VKEKKYQETREEIKKYLADLEKDNLRRRMSGFPFQDLDKISEAESSQEIDS